MIQIPLKKELLYYQHNFSESIIGLELKDNIVIKICLYFYNINSNKSFFKNDYLNCIYNQLPKKIIELTKEKIDYSNITLLDHTEDSIRVYIKDNIYKYVIINNKVKLEDEDTQSIISYIPAETDTENIVPQYKLVSNGVNLQTNTKLIYVLLDHHNIHESLYDILFSTKAYKHFINPYDYNDICNLIYVNADIIKYEFNKFQDLNTEYLSNNLTYNKALPIAVNWIQHSKIHTIENKTYDNSEGYAQGYSTEKWLFIPVYDKIEAPEISYYFLNTLSVIANIPNVKMAGFMILKKGETIEWHKHDSNTTIIHFTLSDTHDNKVEFHVGGTNSIDDYETMNMKEYMSVCCFKTTHFHHTVNYSTTDRVSFVLELY